MPYVKPNNLIYEPPSTQGGTIDPYPPTIVDLNNTKYEYARRYVTVANPPNISKVAAERFAAVGIITTSSYTGLDISVSLGSSTSSYIGVDSTPSYLEGNAIGSETHFKANVSANEGADSYAFYANGGYGGYGCAGGNSWQWGCYIDGGLSNYFGGLTLIGGTGITFGCCSGESICSCYVPVAQVNGGLYVDERVWISGTPPEEDCIYELYVVGDAKVTGELAKGSGSFDIAHPLTEEKRLRHSFVEGPRYDNIYRNKVRLLNGKASVDLDIDCVSPGGQTMTPGTWEKLNRNPDIFLQNLEGWARLRGKINGSILEIECEDENCTDLISWMVVAERHDEHVMNSKMSDDEGRLILEY